ncbi:MAG TPA: DUF4340 domain-containing protein [Gemmatimonadales bacterium]|nr:DUF4340 domain-containing protein [Gemmatimonadales bacterium]
MTSAQLARLAMILGALLLLWGAVSLARRGSQGLSETDRFALPALTRDSVDSVIIMRAADTVRLGRRDSAWTVNGHPASGSAVQQLFGALADTARRTELVGTRPGSHGGFGVDSAKGTRIRIVRGDSMVADLVQGNRGPSLEGGYFRLAADSSVYLVGGDLAEALEQSSEEWRDRRIAGVSEDSVGLIEVTRGRRAYTIRRDSTAWSLVPGGRADSAAVAELLAAYREVEAADFASRAEADSAQLARPDRRVRLLRKDGTPLLALAFDSTANGFWVQAAGDSTVYRLDTWTADRLAPADSTLKTKPAAS